jgi:hypothetical protein
MAQFIDERQEEELNEDEELGTFDDSQAILKMKHQKAKASLISIMESLLRT